MSTHESCHFIRARPHAVGCWHWKRLRADYSLTECSNIIAYVRGLVKGAWGFSSFFGSVRARIVAAVAHADVLVVAAEADLVALGDDVARRVETCVDGRFAAAAADGFDLRDAVRDLKQPLAAREHQRLKIGAQAEAEHRQIKMIHDVFQLFHLFSREELAFVADDDVRGNAPLARREQLDEVVVLRNGVGGGGEADAALRLGDAAAVFDAVVPRVDGGLDEPDRLVLLLVVELGHQRLRGLGTSHRAELEIQLCHGDLLFRM